MQKEESEVIRNGMHEEIDEKSDHRMVCQKDLNPTLLILYNILNMQGASHSHHDESFGDIMVFLHAWCTYMVSIYILKVHQSIHTIEYVLGCMELA